MFGDLKLGHHIIIVSAKVVVGWVIVMELSLCDVLVLAFKVLQKRGERILRKQMPGSKTSLAG
jgi:hypothetical protein